MEMVPTVPTVLMSLVSVCTTPALNGPSIPSIPLQEQYAKEIVKELKESGISVSEMQENKVPEVFGGVKQHQDILEDIRLHAEINCTYHHLEVASQKASDKLKISSDVMCSMLTKRLDEITARHEKRLDAITAGKR
jgi:hypothetical protein